MTLISILCTNISQKLDLVIDNSSTNSSRLSAVELRVDELDQNSKVYVDTKLKSIFNKTVQQVPNPPLWSIIILLKS